MWTVILPLSTPSAGPLTVNGIASYSSTICSSGGWNSLSGSETGETSHGARDAGREYEPKHHGPEDLGADAAEDHRADGVSGHQEPEEDEQVAHVDGVAGPACGDQRRHRD